MTSARPAALSADCSSCFALCCVGLGFAKSADFAFDKRPDDPCRNLGADNRCRIHDALRTSGMRGCTAYDCLGAGQRLSQSTFGGRSWRTSPVDAADMFALLPLMRELHELLSYLHDAMSRPAAADRLGELAELRDEIDRLCSLPAGELFRVAPSAARDLIEPHLGAVSAAVRHAAVDRPAVLRRADLVGAQRRDADLRGADLRGALLIAADLRRADLREADLIGADLRDADLRGANLGGALYVLQTQVNAARGDEATVLPAFVERPAHWG